MISHSLNSISPVAVPVFELPLPLGISFYTFQVISYVVDVYRGDVAPNNGFGKVLLYISLFPQIIAGPIIKYHDIEAQIDNREHDASTTARGLKRFIFGLGKKVFLANTVAATADALFGLEAASLGSLGAWAAAIAYMLQIYLDFSAYSDMAIGLCAMFGFTIPENFKYPYTASSIKEFWRRWHISLSVWFRDYLYIPLGGNRNGKLRTFFNKFAVFFLCGLWHGASWNFVVWGLIHGAFSSLEELLPLHKLPKAICKIYTLLVVCCAFVIFRAESFAQSKAVLYQMLIPSPASHEAMMLLAGQLTPFYLLCAVLAVIACTRLPEKFKDVLSSSTPLSLVSYATSFVLLFACILNLAGGSYNPFIYFRF